jgi:predicted DCC family thiol-disulfide oxidoreductase YuxK
MSEIKFPIIIFNPNCPFCFRFKGAIERLDVLKLINFVSVEDEQIFQQFPDLNKLACLEQIHMIDKHKNIIIGQDVIAGLISSISGIEHLGWLLDTTGGQKAVSFFYDKINELKKNYNEKNNCQRC